MSEKNYDQDDILIVDATLLQLAQGILTFVSFPEHNVTVGVPFQVVCDGDIEELKRAHSPNDHIPGQNAAPRAVKKVKNNTFTFR